MSSTSSTIFLNTSKVYGGVEKNFIVRAKALQLRGYNICVVAGSQAIFDRVKEAGISNVRLIPCSNDYDPIFFFRFFLMLKKVKATVVFLNTKRDYWRGGLPARLAHIKRIIGYWGSDYAIGNKGKLNFVFNKILTKLIVNSVELKQRLLKRNFKIADERIEVIYNGIEAFPETDLHTMDLRTMLNIPGGALIMGSAGRLVNHKKFQVGLDLMKRLDRNCELHYVLAGGGPYENNLRQHAIDLGVADRFHILGDVRDLSKTTFYKEISFFASFSEESEGLPNVLLEALYFNVPVIANNASGVNEALENGNYGLILPNDFVDKSEAFENFVRGGTNQKINSREYVLKKFSTTRMIDETCRVFFDD
jgi:glycosyltransferase involved in cell wall biosynthesis